MINLTEEERKELLTNIKNCNICHGAGDCNLCIADDKILEQDRLEKEGQ